MTTQIFTAVIHQEGKWFVADCPEVGTVSQGISMEEAIANFKEATELYLQEFCRKKKSESTIGTLQSILCLAKVTPEEFIAHL